MDKHEVMNSLWDPNEQEMLGRRMARGRIIVLWINLAMWLLTIVGVLFMVYNVKLQVSAKTVGVFACIAATVSFSSIMVMTLISKKYSQDVRSSKIAQYRIGEESLSIIQTLSKNFNAVYYVNFENGEVRFLQIGPRIRQHMAEEYARKMPFEWYVKAYADKLVLPDDYNDFIFELSRENLQTKLANRLYYTYTYRGDKNGRPNYFQMKAASIDGDVNHLVIGFADVDDEVREDNEKNALLQDALSQAELANKAKDVFLANVSHELLTPLNEIMGHATILSLDEKESENAREEASNICKSTENMSQMVRDILDLSSIEKGELVFEENSLDLEELLNEAVDKEVVSAQEKQINLVRKYDISNKYIVGDRERLTAIMNRLVKYAVRYSRDGGEVIFAVTEDSAPQGKRRYCFNVTDSGYGISEADVNRIYEPFFWEEKFSKDASFGKGLGLSTVRSIVSLMGGKFEIDTIYGKGTTVKLTLTFDKP